jgi:hypothetical protein
MQTQIQTNHPNTNAINKPEESAARLITKRLARIPHAIKLPSENLTAPELYQLLESSIAETEAKQLRLDRQDEDQAFEFVIYKSILSILRLHLDEIRRDFPESIAPPALSIPPLPFTETSSPDANKNNFADLTEPTEPDVDNQPHQTEPEVSRTEPGSPQSEPSEPKDSATRPTKLKSDTSALDKKFAAELKKVPLEYHEIAADLYESLHHRSKFSKLTSEQRLGIYELCEDDEHLYEDILEIISKPPPIGMDFQTSRAGLKRFCADYKRILFDKEKIEKHQRDELARRAADQSFEAANASDETFRQSTERQIRKRLFNAANDPASSYLEIRWLLKSLEHLRKPEETEEAER